MEDEETKNGNSLDEAKNDSQDNRRLSTQQRFIYNLLPFFIKKNDKKKRYSLFNK